MESIVHIVLSRFLKNNMINIIEAINGSEKHKDIVWSKLPPSILPFFMGAYIELNKLLKNKNKPEAIELYSKYINKISNIEIK